MKILRRLVGKPDLTPLADHGTIINMLDIRPGDHRTKQIQTLLNPKFHPELNRMQFWRLVLEPV
jgi:hypothetical protein